MIYPLGSFSHNFFERLRTKDLCKESLIDDAAVLGDKILSLNEKPPCLIQLDNEIRTTLHRSYKGSHTFQSFKPRDFICDCLVKVLVLVSVGAKLKQPAEKERNLTVHICILPDTNDTNLFFLLQVQ